MALKPQLRAPERTISFSDALFAFAITLLAFNIKVPDVPDALTSAQLVSWMASLFPTILIYALSFWVIANFWLAHHHLFEHVRRLDDALIWLNVAFLFIISLIPFPTAVLVEYGHAGVAAILYAAFMGAAGILLYIMWRYAMVNGHLEQGLPQKEFRRRSLHSLIAPAIFLLSIPIALFNPALAELSWLLIFLAKPLAARLSESE